MKNLNITKGKSHVTGLDIRLESGLIIGSAYNHLESNLPKMEQEAIASLFSESFNVANETGLTPRELLNQRDELLYVLSNLIIDARANNDFGCDSNLQSSVESAVKCFLINNDLLPK